MHRLSQSHCRNQVHIKRLQPILAAGGKALVAVSAGQIDQQIDAAKTCAHLFDRMCNEFVIRHVKVKKHGSLTEFGRDLETRFTVDIEQRNASACVHQRLRDGGANQGCATADHGDFILQMRHGYPLKPACRRWRPSSALTYWKAAIHRAVFARSPHPPLATRSDQAGRFVPARWPDPSRYVRDKAWDRGT